MVSISRIALSTRSLAFLGKLVTSGLLASIIVKSHLVIVAESKESERSASFNAV